MKVGILTGGGDCPGLNAVLRAVCKSLILQHDAEIIGFEDGFEGMIERRTIPLTLRAVAGIQDEGGTILGTSNKANPFKYFRRNNTDVSDEVLAYYQDLGLDAVVVLGGDGSMTIAEGLYRKGINILGIPKTIDNDLMGTDQTFGFDTAVSIATEALDRIHTTAQSHHRVLIVELMGRYAGWITLYAGVASGSDIILIPEIPYNIQAIVERCQMRERDGRRFTVIAVAEGAVEQDKGLIVRETISDSPDPIRLGGVANYLAARLKNEIESEIRTTILGHIQRGGTPTPADRVLSTVFGTYAAELVSNKTFGVMVALQNNDFTTIPLGQVAHKTRTVPMGNPVLRAAQAIGTSFGV
ncbi:MAG: ATP-dependent 6-phosphofructokinase [Rhodothermia bacterium]|nr:ATP-dependent 6-phosphofructokinase [Rhodothermia bacterium]